MSRRTLSLVILAALALALVTTFAVAKDETKAAEGKAVAAESGKAAYLVISPHTKAECLAALDGVAAQGADMMARYDWGCMANDHTGYLKVQAASEQEALAMVPESMRSKAKAVKLNKFTVEQVKSFHESEAH